jgi:hypothetical protein
LLFTQDAAPGLASGAITVTFRTWSRAQAKTGGRYRVLGLLLEVVDVKRLDLGSITPADARRAGYESAAALQRTLEPQAPDGMVWRVEFRCLGPDDRIARRNDSTLDSEKLAKLQARLARLDKASATGPWTFETLSLIAAHPGIVSSVLARRLKMERPAFKINVRKLKELGLTESLEVGYRLSPLGEAFVEKEARLPRRLPDATL